MAVNSQTNKFPPAQGPPPGSGNAVLPIYSSTVFLIVDNYLRDSILPVINDSLRENSKIPVSVSHHSRPLMPKMSQTTHNDKPNENIAVIPYEVNYKLNIKGLPDRHLKQRIEIRAFCRNWSASGGGSIKVSVVAENPRLMEESVAEVIINTLFLGYYTKFVNREINKNLPDMIVKQLVDSDIKCNCLTLDPGQSPAYEGSIKYYFTPPPMKAELNGYRVSIKNIKKLSATSLQGSPLFTGPENLNVTYYVNQKSENRSIQGIQPGQVRNLPENDFFIPKPAQNGNIVIIVAISRSNDNTDAGYIVLDQSNSFGMGGKKIIIQRSYSANPVRLENGATTKGTEVKANAYEITVQIQKVAVTDVLQN
jgi:hypothetical protein